MGTDFRFSLTPRMVTLGAFGFLALLVLVFLIGMQVGGRLADAPAKPQAAGVPAPSATQAQGALRSAVQEAAQPGAKP